MKSGATKYVTPTKRPKANLVPKSVFDCFPDVPPFLWSNISCNMCGRNAAKCLMKMDGSFMCTHHNIELDPDSVLSDHAPHPDVAVLRRAMEHCMKGRAYSVYKASEEDKGEFLDEKAYASVDKAIYFAVEATHVEALKLGAEAVLCWTPIDENPGNIMDTRYNLITQSDGYYAKRTNGGHGGDSDYCGHNIIGAGGFVLCSVHVGRTTNNMDSDQNNDPNPSWDEKTEKYSVQPLPDNGKDINVAMASNMMESWALYRLVYRMFCGIDDALRAEGQRGHKGPDPISDQEILQYVKSNGPTDIHFVRDGDITSAPIITAATKVN